MYNLHDPGGKYINVWVGDCCSRKLGLRKFLTKDDTQPKSLEFSVSGTTHKAGKLLVQTSGTVPTESVGYTPKVCALVASTPRCQQPKREPQNQKIRGFGNWFHPSCRTKTYSQNSPVKLFLKSKQKWRRYRQKTSRMGGSRTNEKDYRQKTAFAVWPS